MSFDTHVIFCQLKYNNLVVKTLLLLVIQEDDNKNYLLK